VRRTVSSVRGRACVDGAVARSEFLAAISQPVRRLLFGVETGTPLQAWSGEAYVSVIRISGRAARRSVWRPLQRDEITISGAITLAGNAWQLFGGITKAKTRRVSRGRVPLPRGRTGFERLVLKSGRTRTSILR